VAILSGSVKVVLDSDIGGYGHLNIPYPNAKTPVIMDDRGVLSVPPGDKEPYCTLS